MRTLCLRVFLLFFCLFATSSCKKPRVVLHIAAAGNLSTPLLAIAEEYTYTHPEVQINFHFGSSNALSWKIYKGSRTDVYILDAQITDKAFKEKNITLQSWPRLLLTNELALFARKDRTDIQNFEDLKKRSVKKICVGEPESLALGHYTQVFLQNTGLLKALASKFVYTQNSVNMLSYVNRGDVDAGISFVSNKQLFPDLKLVEKAPQEDYPPIKISVGILKKASRIEDAGEFALYLFSPKAQQIFKNNGLQLITETLPKENS